jgi:type I restriction enzyme S subunit
MKGNWKQYKFSEFAEQRKEQVAPNGEEQPYIGLEHIEQQKLRITGIGSSKDVISNKYKFYTGDILYGKLRPYFRKVYHPKFNGVCSTDIFVIVNKKPVVKDFLYYLVATEDFTSIANSGSSGTRMPRADWNQLAKTEWNIPEDLNEQKSLANILSTLDDKIELNREMNQTLEDLCQSIFKEWFVNFNFPDFDGELVDGLPDGWSIGKLNQIVDVKGGSTPSTTNPDYWNGVYHWTTPKDLSNIKSSVLLETERKITEAGVKQISSGILPEGTLLLSSRAPIGYLAISQIPISINQGYIAIQGKAVSNFFMLNWLKQNMDSVKGMANGSTFQEINKSNFKQIEIVIPDKGALNSFDEVAKPIFQKIVLNEIESKSLIEIRDGLLPKLMTGKIEIKD